MSNIKLSVSTFSAGKPFADGMSFEEFVRRIAEIGYTGIELVSAQIVPGYPYPSDAWIEETKAILKKYNVELAAYGGYVDVVRFHGRNLTDEEILSFTRNDMVIAHRLGAKVLKTGERIGAHNLRALIPECERWGIWIGLELHGPETLQGELWSSYLELFREDGGKHFGIVPDTGIYQELPNETFVNESLEAGISRDRYDAIEAGFAAKKPVDELCAELALNELETGIAQQMYGKFTTNELDTMDLTFRYSRYTHGKYFYIDENLTDRGINFANIVECMKRQNYDGYLSAEYEGYFHDISVDTFDQLDRYFRLMKNLI